MGYKEAVRRIYEHIEKAGLKDRVEKVSIGTRDYKKEVLVKFQKLKPEQEDMILDLGLAERRPSTLIGIELSWVIGERGVKDIKIGARDFKLNKVLRRIHSFLTTLTKTEFHVDEFIPREEDLKFERDINNLINNDEARRKGGWIIGTLTSSPLLNIYPDGSMSITFSMERNAGHESYLKKYKDVGWLQYHNWEIEPDEEAGLYLANPIPVVNLEIKGEDYDKIVERVEEVMRGVFGVRRSATAEIIRIKDLNEQMRDMGIFSHDVMIGYREGVWVAVAEIDKRKISDMFSQEIRRTFKNKFPKEEVKNILMMNTSGDKIRFETYGASVYDAVKKLDDCVMSEVNGVVRKIPEGVLPKQKFDDLKREQIGEWLTSMGFERRSGKHRDIYKGKIGKYETYIHISPEGSVLFGLEKGVDVRRVVMDYAEVKKRGMRAGERGDRGKMTITFKNGYDYLEIEQLWKVVGEKIIATAETVHYGFSSHENTPSKTYELGSGFLYKVEYPTPEAKKEKKMSRGKEMEVGL